MTAAGSTACDASSDPLDGALLRALVERLPLPVALLDEELRLVGANPALAELAGTSAAALVGAAWCPRFVPAAQRAGVRRRLAGAAAADRPIRIEHALAAGGALVAWHVVPLPRVAGAAGAPVLALAGVDVTAERRATASLAAERARARHAGALKSRRLADAARDLQAPTQTLRLLAYVLARSVADGAGHDAVSQLAATVERLAHEVDGLAGVVRREEDAAAPQATTVALGPLLAAVGERFADAATAKGLRLAVVATSLAARTDRRRLAAMLEALVGAAVRDTESGRVVVGCRRRGDDVTIEVADGRTTPPQAEIAELWGPEGGRAAPPFAGTPLAQRLEALDDHRLEFRFVPGRGAHFSVRLPLAGGTRPSPRRRPGTRGRTVVLVVAADAGERAALARLLELDGYEVAAVADDEAALATLARAPRPHLAVLDRAGEALAAPTDLARRLRERRGAPMPIVILSDHVPPLPAPSAAAGALRFLEKPIEPATLLAVVAELGARTDGAAARRRGGGERAGAAAPAAVVAVVAADGTTRAERRALLEDRGLATLATERLTALFADGAVERAACVLVEDRADAVDPDDLAAVTRSGFDPPVVVVQPAGDVAAAVALMRAGAFDVLADPGDEAVVEAVQLALREGERRGRRLEQRAASRQRFERLTGREREVLALVVAGHANKLVAQRLGISPRTVENHRARIMEKTGAHSLPELVAQARRAGLVP